MEAMIKRILENINQLQEDYALLESSDSMPFLINKEKFQDMPDKRSGKKIIFIDGGNMEVFRSPSLSVFFNRIYYTIYHFNKRIKSNSFEFYNLISSVNKDNKIYYRTEYFFIKNKLELKEYQFDSFDKLLCLGNRRAPISLIGDVIRRYAEICVPKSLTEKECIIVFDGTLEAVYPGEEQLLDKLYLENTNTICGISKTLNLITRNGNSLGALLSNSSNKKIWFYNAISVSKKNHNADIYFTKLHPKTEYIFRLDINNSKKFDINEVMYLLKENSKDPIFIGYPYGLVEADRFARVSKREKEDILLQLKFRFKKDYDKIKPYLNSVNAHDILDNVS